MSDLVPFVNLVLGSGGIIGLTIIIFRTGKIVEKIDSIEKRLDKLENNLPQIVVAIAKMEVRLEERTPNKQKELS